MIGRKDSEMDKLEVLLDAMSGGGAGAAIERQEKRGQDDLVRKEVLPKECPRADLEKLGFVFGEDVDDLFVYVQLPAGWKKVATEHSMHTSLVDDKGRIRGNIFYKAAFYDRRASMYLLRRFGCGHEPINGYGDDYNRNDPHIGVVRDNGVVIWRTEREAPSGDKPDYKLADELADESKAWLTEHYPDWENVLAYWD